MARSGIFNDSYQHPIRNTRNLNHSICFQLGPRKLSVIFWSAPRNLKYFARPACQKQASFKAFWLIPTWLPRKASCSFIWTNPPRNQTQCAMWKLHENTSKIIAALGHASKSRPEYFYIMGAHPRMLGALECATMRCVGRLLSCSIVSAPDFKEKVSKFCRRKVSRI